MQIYQYLFEDRVDLRVAAQKMLGIVGRPATDIDGGVSVTFSGVAEGEEPKDELSRVFPKERLDDANAGFRQARVGYEVFSLGPCNVSKMTNEGPTFEELTSPQRDPLSDVDFERLQKKE